MKTINNGSRSGFKALKEKFLKCFGARAENGVALQDVVSDLIDHGISRQTLEAWLVKKGFSKGYIASALSRIFVALGLRERKKGAGRKPSPAALELLAHAQSLYGENFLRVLYAACRAGKAQLAATNVPNKTNQPRLKANCTSTIRRATRPAGRINGGRYRSANTNFKRTFKPATEISSEKHGTV